MVLLLSSRVGFTSTDWQGRPNSSVPGSGGPQVSPAQRDGAMDGLGACDTADRDLQLTRAERAWASRPRTSRDSIGTLTVDARPLWRVPPTWPNPQRPCCLSLSVTSFRRRASRAE